MDVFWKRKKNPLLIVFNRFLFIAKIISHSCIKNVQLLFKKKYEKKIIFLFKFRCLKMSFIGAVLVLPKINALFLTYLLHSFYFRSKYRAWGLTYSV